jgi:hypothetical protein
VRADGADVLADARTHAAAREAVAAGNLDVQHL